MRRICTYLFLFILTLSYTYAIPQEHSQKEVFAPSVFKDSIANIEEINISSNVALENQIITIDIIRQICDDISDRLNVLESSDEEYVEEGFSQVIRNGKIDDGLSINLLIQSSEYDDFKESSIIINLIGTSDIYYFEEIYDKIDLILSDYGKPNTTMTITGYYEGLKDTKEISEIINNLFVSIGAKKVEGINNEDLVSLTGYTENIKNHITVGGKKVNINIAGRYNSYEDKTYIYMGTPLIITEY